MPERVTAFAPGRVNLIGEHTDYSSGLCLPFALDRGLEVSARARDDELVDALAQELGERDRFALGAQGRASGWPAYVRGAAAELQSAGHPLRGAQVEIRSELPVGGGLASSAALTIATCLALLALAGQTTPPAVALARLCQAVERKWAGADTGLLDQLAILCARPGHALRIDTASLAIEPVPLRLGGATLWLLDSGARHDHATGAYNERRSECRAACELLGVENLRSTSSSDAARLPAPLDRRVRHVVSENGRVDRMVQALKRSDPAAIAEILEEGHRSLRDDYEVSAPAVEEARARLRAAGARGARLVGGGFGGHVVGLFPPGTRPPAGAIEVRAGGGATLRSSGAGS